MIAENGNQHDLWSLVRIAVLGAHAGDREAFHQGMAGISPTDEAFFMRWRMLVQYMAYSSIARRVDHRPLVIADAEQAARELLPRVRRIGAARKEDLLTAIKLALVLDPGPDFDPHDVIAGTAVVVLWTALVGACISDAGEFEGMRDGARRYFVKRGIEPDGL